MIEKTEKARDKFLESLYGFLLYDYQKKISDVIVANTIKRRGEEGAFEISRQAGKSLGFVLTESYLSIINDILYGEPIHVGFFAPRQEQVKTSFDRFKDYLPIAAEAFNMKFMEKNSGTLVMARPRMHGGRNYGWDKVYTAYAMTLGETAHVESKTLHRAYIDEAQDVDDFKVNKEVIPMLSATAGNLYRIGVAGYHNCDFKKAIEKGENVVIADVEAVKKDRRKMFEETKEEKHLLYERFYDDLVEKVGGQDVDFIRTQFLLQWIVEKGTMVTREKLEACRRPYLCVDSPDIVLAVDLAKKSDSTVVTASTTLGQRLRSWELKGYDYNDQYPAICEAGRWLEKQGYRIVKIRVDTTGSAADAAGEALQKHPECRWNVEFFYFAPQNKHNLYQMFISLIEMGAAIGQARQNDNRQRRFEYWEGDPNRQRFEYQMLDMIKEYKGAEGNLLSCHHPDTPGALDDHCDSTAMSVYEVASVESKLSFGFLDT